ncbi:hypothetical protein KKF34_11015 [Myxococcota bacterium]|nr:hypothetical protein [Myxococcota bacterium]MBU1379919.1 hypothetical protein [Myxococcota bacterium]MBU1497396.1 hypothetical protein [Myxococcota bacterium]
MPGIGVISNANARLNKMAPWLKNRLNFILGRRGELINTYTLEDVDKALQDFINLEVDIIAISGGDGTAHRTIEKLLKAFSPEKLPPLLLLPSGTQNMVPKSLGITGNSITTMLQVQTMYTHNIPIKTIRRNLLKVNEHYSFMFGLGVPPRYLQRHYARGTSHWNAVTLLADYAWDGIKKGDKARELFKPVPMKYSVNGSEPIFNETIHTIFCSFAEELALRWRCFPRAGWQKDNFETLFVDSNFLQTFPILGHLWAGSMKELKGLERHMTTSVRLELETPEPCTLDGDLYEPELVFDIKPGPELRFVVPSITNFDRNINARSEKTGPWGRVFYV